MSDGHNAIEGTATDPVCGMSVKMDGARFIDRHEGGDHYFCSSRCLDKFRADPEMYLSKAHLDAVEDVPEGTIYTCPMHPEVVRAEPNYDYYDSRRYATTCEFGIVQPEAATG